MSRLGEGGIGEGGNGSWGRGWLSRAYMTAHRVARLLALPYTRHCGLRCVFLRASAL